jgi:hypothetical protein
MFGIFYKEQVMSQYQVISFIQHPITKKQIKITMDYGTRYPTDAEKRKVEEFALQNCSKLNKK